MPLSLTLVTNGTPITAAGVRDYVDKIEYYVNEGIPSTDLPAGAWVESTHVFRPEFYGSPNARMEAVGGIALYAATSDSLYTAASFNYRLGRDEYVPVPGLQKTVRVQGGSSVRVLASFAAYEWGGDSSPLEGGTALPSVTDAVCEFRLFRNAQVGGADRKLFPSGYLPATAPPPITIAEASAQVGGLIARKQISFASLYGETSDAVVNYGVRVRLFNGRVAGSVAEHLWKHVFVLQRNFVVDCSDF